MDTIQSTGVAASQSQDAGFMAWLRTVLLRFLGVGADENASPSPEQAISSPITESSDSEGIFVVAPGGYRIRVPHPSDVGHSVGDMLPSVREGLNLLPPLPTVVIELLREIQDPKSTASSVAEVASSDPSLAASLLRTANGAAMGLSRTITSVSEAVSYLGFGTVKAMVIRLRLDLVLQPKNDELAQDAEDLWIHSLAVSYAAECLSQRVSGVDHGFVATLGLLHDIGKLAVLAQLPEQAAELRKQAAVDSANRLEREAQVLGLDHAGLGANLTAKWNLPADLVQAIRWHHRPANAFHPTDPPPLRKALHLVQIANQLVKYCFPHTDNMEIDAVGDEAFELLALDSSMAHLLDKPVRDAISRAIFFADSSSRRPPAATRRFLRPLGPEEASTIAAAATTPAPLITVDDELFKTLFTDDVTEISVETSVRVRPPSEKHMRFKAHLSPTAIPKLLTTAKAHQEALNLSLEARSSANYTVKSLIPNLQLLSAANETVELAQKQEGRTLTMAFRTPGLAIARRAPASTSPIAASRIAEADFANLLNLGWFERIVISSDGSAVAFVGH